jgi:hypothetical protein
MGARRSNQTQESIMKNVPLLLSLLAILAAAQPVAAEGRRHPRPTFTELDADADGVVTEDEFIAPLLEHASERFAAIDTDDDGVIIETELEAAPFGPRRRASAQ